MLVREDREKSEFSPLMGGECLSYRMEDVLLGETVSVRLIALTDHPVGQQQQQLNHTPPQLLIDTTNSDIEINNNNENNYKIHG